MTKRLSIDKIERLICLQSNIEINKKRSLQLNSDLYNNIYNNLYNNSYNNPYNNFAAGLILISNHELNALLHLILNQKLLRSR